MGLTHYCYIHIGAPKTGSTLIQRVLSDNRDILRKAGIEYPDVSLRGYGHHDLAFLVGGGYPEWATPQPKSLDELAAQLEVAAKVDASVLLSSEDFYLCPNPEGLRELLARTHVFDKRAARIIVYVRRQDDAHESWYNQTIKAQGYTHDIETCIAEFHDLWDYRKQLDRWAAAFGQAAISVRPYDDACYAGGTLLSDFFSVLGISTSGLTVKGERVNTSLNSDVLEFARAVNRLPLDTVKKRAFHHRLIDLSQRSSGTGLFNERPLLRVARRREILEGYAAGNGAVAKQFLGMDHLFDETLPSNEEPNNDPSTLSAEKLAAIVAWLLLEANQQ